MKAFHTSVYLLFSALLILLLAASCKKNNSGTPKPVDATPTQIGLYEADSSVYKELEIAISKIGNQTVDDGLAFDTGSGGMVIDAEGILPASMITSSGFNFTTDSTVVNGITITSQRSTIEYGDDAATTDKVYGYLAYAPITVGDQGGTISIKRLPFFLYYKAVDGQGNQFDPHEFDVFGVDPEYDVTFQNNVNLSSPFSYYDPGTGLTKGFKMAALGTSYFTLQGGYSPEAVTVGLTASDLSSSSGFVTSQLTFNANYGYSPVIPATLAYNGKSLSAQVLFDTGTEPYSYIEDRTAADTLVQLPVNTKVTLSTTSGFNYSYTVTSLDNLTNVENPSVSQTDISVFGLEFFLNNSYLLDYPDHKLGIKNN